MAVGGVEAGSWNEGIAGRDLVGRGRREGWPRCFIDSGCETSGSRAQTLKRVLGVLGTNCILILGHFDVNS